MSINVTVTGNPVCIKKKIVLSDLEQIKKNERERRRRLRLAQVRQQSKDMSSKLLERAKNIAKIELNRFENKDSELHCLHNKKIMDIQQKYADDMEDIGLAHNSAVSQLTHNSADVDKALEFEKRLNHSIALERGKIASQRFKDSAKDNNPAVQQQERLRQVRNIENLRSSMVANLEKPSSSKKNPSTVPINSSLDSNDDGINNHISPKKQVPKKVIGKKSPVKLITKPAIKIVSTYRKSKSPARQQKVLTENPRKTIVTNANSTNIDEIFSAIKPQQIKVSSHVNSEKAETIVKYNPRDYRQVISESSETTDNSSTDFEVVENKIDEKSHKKVSESPKKVSKSTSISSNKIYTYDHFTGQRNTYDSPIDLAERLDRTNEPNANEIAQRTSYTETNESIRINKKSNNHIKTQSRGQSAMLREQVRQDSENLFKNLDHLSREEKKLKAAALVSPKKYNELSGTRERRKELHDIKQRKMNRAFDDVQNERTMPLVERIITIRSSPPPQINSDNEEQNYPGITRDEQILEMLQKIERQKRLLLNEFGTNLPENIINSSMTRLFENTLIDKNLPQKVTPEIEIIKITKDDKTDNKQVKDKNAVKTKDKEIAVQTSLTEDIVKDKSTQVELLKSDDDKENRNDETLKNSSTKSETLRYVEPIVTVIRHDVGDSSSNDTSPGIIINLTNKKLEVTPKTKKSSKKYEIKSLPTSGAGSPVKKTSTSAPVSRTTSPKKREKPRKYKVYEKKKPDKHEYVDTSTDVSFNHLNSTDNHYQQQQQQQQFNEQTRIPRQSMTRNTYVSDTSTSYASLPAVQPGSYRNNDNNITPILQMLDSSSDIVRRVRDISPVSTPETPSPRTLRIPSNKPNPLRFGRALKFDAPGKSTDKQRQFNDRRIFFKNKNDTGENVCTCKNPNCQYFHKNINESRGEFRIINHPQVLKKYDELENICTERLASLNALINRGRDDSQVTDYSLVAPSDDTIMMQMPPPRPARSDVYSVKKLVESIEVIHSQLAKTLSESQKIMTGNVRPVVQEDENELLSKKIQETSLSVNDKDKFKKPKPKIISNETIKVDLERFKPVPLTQKKNNIVQDDIVEKLSKEILEQSKNVDKTSLRKSPESHYLRKNKELTDDIDGDQRKFKATGTEADVSKRNKILPSTNIRARPPVSNLNGQFGIDLTSPRHELSTIVEFDTSSTVINRSEANIASPIKEVKRILTQANIRKPNTTINENSTKDNLIIEKISPPQQIRKLISDRISPPDYEKTNKQFKLRSNGFENPTESLVMNYNFEKLEKSLKINQISHPVQLNGGKINEKITSSSSNSFLEVSGISEFYSTPTTRGTNFVSSASEDVEDRVKKLGMAWAVTTLRKTREASALSSSSNSDATGDLSRILSYKTTSNRTNKTNDNGKKCSGLPDFSDVSSISIKETNKSTEYGVLMKARTSTPNIQCSNYSSKSSISMTSATITSQENGNSIELLTRER